MAIMCAMDLNSNKSIKLQTDTKIEKIEKVEKNIIEKSTEENVEDNKANNIIVNKKMSEDKMEKEEFEKSIQEKDSAISELNTKLATQEKMLQEIEESKLTELKESYTTIAKEKGVEPIDVSEATKDLMSALISQIKAIEKVTEVKKETTKGIVKSKNVSQENGDNYFITREDTVNGVAIFKSPISEDSNSVFFRG